MPDLAKLEEEARKFADEKYPGGDFAQYGDPIDELVQRLSEFARDKILEERERGAEIRRAAEHLLEMRWRDGSVDVEDAVEKLGELLRAAAIRQRGERE